MTVLIPMPYVLRAISAPDHAFRRPTPNGIVQSWLPGYPCGFIRLTAQAGATMHEDLLGEPPANPTLIELVKQIREPLAVLGGCTTIYRNGRLDRLLKEDPEGDRIERAARKLVSSLDERCRPPCGECTAGTLRDTVGTSSNRYELTAGCLPTPAGSERLVLVLVRPGGEPAFPSVPEVTRRWPLTRREAQTALLLARGYPTKNVAKEMDISWHTARGYVDRVLRKLEVRSRAAVGPILLS